MSAEVPTVERALVLASAARVAACGRGKYLGLTVPERVVRNLRARGVSEILVFGDEEALPAALRSTVEFVSGNSEAAAIRAALEGDAESALLVVPADVVYHPQLVPRLAVAAQTEANSQVRAEADCSAVVAGESDAHAALLVPRGCRQALAELESDLAGVVEALAAAEQLTRAPVVESWSRWRADALFVVPFRPDSRAGISPRRASRARARRLLMKLNWRPHDGIVAALINKHISVPISAAIANVSVITPNVMTAVAFAVALVGIALSAYGSYWSFVLGAGLIQIQSILDGCDGELARLRYLSSSFGAWFDTVVDDVIGVLWFVALGCGAYRMTGQWLFLAASASATALYALALTGVYTALIRGRAQSHSDFVWFYDEGRDAHTEPPDPKKLSTWATYVVRRDFYVLFFFALGLAGQLPVAAVIAALAATAWFIVGMIHFSKRGLSLRPRG